MGTLKLLLVILILAGAVGTAVVYRFRILLLRKKLFALQVSRAESVGFMNLFSRNIRNMRDTVNWMNVTAKYVADTINASSICIFTKKGDALYLAGSSGTVPSSLRTIQIRMEHQKSMTELFKEQQTGGAEQSMEENLNVLENAARQKEYLFISDPRDHRLQELDPKGRIRTMMVVPLQEDGVVLGLLCAINNSRGKDKSFEQDQFGRLKFISGQVVLAENIMQVYSAMSEQQRISQELVFARNMQKSLLPQSIPVWGQFTIHAMTRASKEVSGDFYDFVEIDDDHLLIVIGDACGKGVPACMIMAMTRSFIRANTGRFTSMKDMLTELNDNLFRDMGDGRYITLGIILLDRRESTLQYARAGHTELLIFIREHIRSIYPDGTGLGLLPSMLAEFDTFNMEFAPGMEVLMFTDGINEATAPDGTYFGVDRIKEIFTKSCHDQDQPRDTIARIMGAVDDFSQKPESQSDDQTLVIIRHG